MCVLLIAKAGWEGEEAGRRVRPGRGGQSQGHRVTGGQEQMRNGGKGEGGRCVGERTRSKADAHIEKSTSLVTFSCNKAGDLWYYR